MRKWGRKSTSTLKAQVEELQETTVGKKKKILPGKWLLHFPVVSL